jgi:hypothetical protein
LGVHLKAEPLQEPWAELELPLTLVLGLVAELEVDGLENLVCQKLGLRCN